jgi:hypothetical protein
VPGATAKVAAVVARVGPGTIEAASVPKSALDGAGGLFVGTGYLDRLRGGLAGGHSGTSSEDEEGWRIDG